PAVAMPAFHRERQWLRVPAQAREQQMHRALSARRNRPAAPIGPQAGSAIVLDGRAGAVLLDRLDGVLSARLARIALGREHHFAIIFETDAELASLVLV